MAQDYPNVSFYFPRNEIPKWFTYQNEESSINITLVPHWHDINFMGFALCVVVACEHCSSCDELCVFNVVYDFHLITNYGESFEFDLPLGHGVWECDVTWKNSSDNVLMCYKYKFNHMMIGPIIKLGQLSS